MKRRFFLLPPKEIGAGFGQVDLPINSPPECARTPLVGSPYLLHQTLRPFRFMPSVGRSEFARTFVVREHLAAMSTCGCGGRAAPVTPYRSLSCAVWRRRALAADFPRGRRASGAGRAIDLRRQFERIGVPFVMPRIP